MTTDAVRALLTDEQFADLKAAVLARVAPKEWMTREEAADYMGMSPQNLDLLRKDGGGPEFSTFGRLIRYNKAKLDQWGASNNHEHAAAASVAKAGGAK
ncbi:hypothetical protein B1992_10420 [Pseudoxanthomonas broegbernensis]|uniref:Helix-turn-helix domain-containing protein n=1 Tax=Pseudoxanthomonas broegbernensis TaxID=83619 RepID=A0A7V8K6X7_9GAMM|nr:helix-turn-helix domain-containing protein [Pseudoxanthomonas broegbernensis]KAF1685879.1 hypothetical protein B1992_10420 [Pseudoxanthomonas broegbernensis]MBB6064100.1 hypothetical protein [Pseudoxanthomonas broegbernensis]